jgi:hypothetical protein
MNFKEKISELEKLNGLIAVLGMIILFPGFFIYHLVIAASGMAPVLGGLFGVASLVIVIWYLIGFVCIPKLQFKLLQWYGLFFLGFVSFVIIWALSHWLLLDESYVYVALIQTVETVILWLALFLIALWLPINSKLLKETFLYFFVATLLGLCLFVWVSGSLEFNVRRLFSAGENVASYAGFSRSMVVVLLFLAAYTLNYLKFCSLTVAGMFTLFLLSARTEFLVFPLALMALFFMSSQTIKRMLILCVVGLLFVTLLVTLVTNFAELTDQNRFSELLKFDNSSSWLKRKELYDIAVSQIMNQPFSGFFGGHIAAESRGGYAHNILSSWVNFGLIGFVLYFSLSFISLVGSFIGLAHVSANNGNENESMVVVWRQSFVLNVFSFVLIMFIKSVFWPVAALAWGLYARALYFSHLRNWKNNAIEQSTK